MHRWRTGLAIVLLICLLAVTLCGSAFEARAFQSAQAPVLRIGEQESSYGVMTPWGGLAFDSAGNLWVADSENNRVLGFTAPFSDNMSASFIIGQPDYRSTTAGTIADRLKFPMDVAFDHAGNLWVVDTNNNRVLEFRAPLRSGMNASVVIGQPNFSTRFSNTTRDGLNCPGQVIFDSVGNLWVADSCNARILEFQPPFNTGMNASLAIGEPDFTHRYCQPSTVGYDATCSNHSILTGPDGIALDLQGDLWVADSPAVNGRLLEFKPPFHNGMQTSLVMEPVFASAIKFDSAGNMWLACEYCYGGGGGSVVEYRPPFGAHSIMWENGYALNASLRLGGFGENSPLSSVLVLPVGLTFDSAGNLWVVDARSSWLIGLNGRVVGYDARVHPLDTPEGRVYFENRVGLLAPLLFQPCTVPLVSFTDGMFNFTIQGLPPGGSVKVTITFPEPLPSGVVWWRILSGNPCGIGKFESGPFPANQTVLNGNNMTLTLANASSEGVISVVGGPAFPPEGPTSTSAGSTSTATLLQPQSGSPNSLVAIPLAIAILIAAIVVTAYRKRHTEPPRREVR